ncbi:MAG: outer membrane protein [Vicinamibacterales bacterium]
MKRVPSFALLALLLIARSASADVTGFLGLNTTPESRTVKGGAAGAGLLIVGVEFEYAATDEEVGVSPSLKTGMGNVYLQTPVAIARLQPYVTTGGGFYRERFGTSTHTGFGLNSGGGVKVTLAGPLRLRLDYRVFRLGDEARHSPAHRFYAGLNLKF